MLKSVLQSIICQNAQPLWCSNCLNKFSRITISNWGPWHQILSTPTRYLFRSPIKWFTLTLSLSLNASSCICCGCLPHHSNVLSSTLRSNSVWASISGFHNVLACGSWELYGSNLTAPTDNTTQSGSVPSVSISIIACVAIRILQ